MKTKAQVLALVGIVFVAVMLISASMFNRERFRVFNESDSGESAQLVFIDLSDTVNFSHSDTGHLLINSVYLQASVDGKHWDMHFGVITATGSTEGTVCWLWHTELGLTNQYQGEFVPLKFERPINLARDGSTLLFFRTTCTTDADWDNDEVHTTIFGDTVMVAVGDLILETIEIEDAKNLLYSMMVEYTTSP